MIIALDEVIPYGYQAFARAGEVRHYAAHRLSRNDLKDVDALVVRSATKVNAALLEGTPVRFVGTATIGMDHVDQEYLSSRGIRFVNAAGSNANSVAEYVTASLLVLAARHGWDLASRSIAIIGVGNVGSRVELKARALGMQALLCDPPLRDTTGDPRYQPLEQVLGADILTFHVPLTRTGPYPTFHMIGESVFGRLTGRQYIMNSARGSVFDEPSLKHALRDGRLQGAALDVWENEPRIDFDTVDLAEIATAHIAGYSLDGKVRGTGMILDEIARFFGLNITWDTSPLFPPPTRLKLDGRAQPWEAIRKVVLQAYDVMSDDRRLRALRGLPPDDAARGFDRLRDLYLHRPEFNHFIVEYPRESGKQAGILRKLGFRTEESEHTGEQS